MLNKIEHPFQPGTEVAIVSGYENGGWTKGKVAKVHKNGNFTLEGDSQQWKSYYSYSENHRWRAEKTGQTTWSRYSPHIEVITPKFLAAQAERTMRHDLTKRGHIAIQRIRDMRGEHLTRWQIEQLEYFLALCGQPV